MPGAHAGGGGARRGVVRGCGAALGVGPAVGTGGGGAGRGRGRTLRLPQCPSRRGRLSLRGVLSTLYWRGGLHVFFFLSFAEGGERDGKGLVG